MSQKKKKKSHNLKSTAMNPVVTSITPRTPPTVFFTDTAWAKLWQLIDVCKKEVGWFGTVEEFDNGDFLIEDIFVPEQEVTLAETDIKSEAMAQLALDLEMRGIDSTKLRYWGHSHVNMAVSPSATDEDQIAEYLDDVEWFIRGIHNKRGEQKIDVYDVNAGFIYQCVDGCRLPAELGETESAEFLADVKANVVERVYTPAWKSNNGNNNKGFGKQVVPRQYNAYANQLSPPANSYDFYEDDEIARLCADPFGIGNCS